MMEPTEEKINRVTDQVKTNTQLFLDELWKQSDKGKEIVNIDIGELEKIDDDYKYIVLAYLIYLQKIGCIAYDYDYFGEHYLVAVKRKEESTFRRKTCRGRRRNHGQVCNTR